MTMNQRGQAGTLLLGERPHSPVPACPDKGNHNQGASCYQRCRQCPKQPRAPVKARIVKNELAKTISHEIKNFLIRTPLMKHQRYPLPHVLHALEQNQDVMIWLGHSSFFIQLDGKTFLIDPVLSQNASPIPFTNQAFAGTSIYTAEDFPEIDYLLISHDHWDHLDYPSVSALRDKIGTIVTGLGVGAHFERWGFPPSQIHEADWNTSLTVDEGFQLHILPARHFSGRWLERDQSLWVAFALKSPTRSLFFSGDSGYGNHFREIGNALGGFDLAMLDVGQYDLQWRYVHMLPEDAANASRDLNSKAMMPANVGKFSMAFHRWDEPFRELSAMQGDLSPSLVTPLIGETVDLSQIGRGFTPWWRLGEDQQTQLAESEG